MIDSIYFSNYVRGGGSHLGNMAIGSLFDRLAEELIDNQMLQTAGSTFRLLGVYSRHTGHSLGALPEVLPPTVFQHLVFNFEIVGRKKSGYRTVFRSSNKALMSGRTRLDTLAVGLSASECMKLGLSMSKSDLLFYSRSVSVFLEQLRVWRRQYNQDYPSSIPVLAQKYLQMPFGTVVRLPFKFWLLCKDVWKNPMLVSPKWVTADLALYYWAFIYDDVQANPNSNLRRLMPVLKKYLRDSILHLRQAINNKSDIGETSEDLIAPVLLSRLVARNLTFDPQELNMFVRSFDDEQLVEIDRALRSIA